MERLLITSLPALLAKRPRQSFRPEPLGIPVETDFVLPGPGGSRPALQAPVLTGEGLRPASVLILLYPKDGRLHVVFTQRTNKVAHHKGQISFPGGRKDPTDASVLDTALRESHEEIGLDPRLVQVLGMLDDHPTNSRFVVTPFVGYTPEAPSYLASEHEVDEIIEAPLDHLMHLPNRVIGWRAFEGYVIQTHSFVWQQRVIWGVTGRILAGFLTVLSGARA